MPAMLLRLEMGSDQPQAVQLGGPALLCYGAILVVKVSSRCSTQTGLWLGFVPLNVTGRVGLQDAHVGMLAEAQAAVRVSSGVGMCAQVEQLQAQVRVLQAVGYGAVETDDAAGSGPGAADSLEAALLGKARRLEHDLTMARLRMAELAGKTLYTFTQ